MLLNTLLISWAAIAAWLIALGARDADRSWITPASLFGMIWAAYIPTILLFAEDPAPFVAGMVWIALACVLPVLIGSGLVGNHAGLPGPRTPVASPTALRVLRRVTLACVLVGAADVAYLFHLRGYSASGVLSFAILSQVIDMNRTESYAGELDTTVLQRLAFITLYVGALYGGVLFRTSSLRADKVRGLLALSFVVFVNALHGSRFGSIYGGGFWLSSFLSAHVLMTNPTEGTPAKFLVRFGLAGGVVVFLFAIGTMALRYAMFLDTEGGRVGWLYIISDPFGFHAAFSLWFSDMWPNPDGPLWGARTFRRLYGLIAGNTPELYLPVDVGFNSSNVYTIFRELIEDFTLVGSVLLLAGVGFVGRRAFLQAARGHHSAIPTLAIVYAFLITSVASSAFGYTTIIAAAVIFAVTFRLVPPITVEVPTPVVSKTPRLSPWPGRSTV
jgi:oligosaccharide repeat unit polymerase